MIAESTSTDRLAQAFQTLVATTANSDSGCWRSRKTTWRRRRSGAPKGSRRSGTTSREKLLTSYSDEPYVSEQYGRELSRREDAGDRSRTGQRRSAGARRRVADHVCDDGRLRALDLALLLDLLRIEQDDARWGELMTPVVRLLEDLLLVGDFDAAARADRRASSAKAAGSRLEGRAGSTR